MEFFTEFVRTFFFFRTTGNINIWRVELLKPFEKNVWLTLIILIFLISIMIQVIFEFHRNTCHGSSVLITFGAFCQQGINKKLAILTY